MAASYSALPAERIMIPHGQTLARRSSSQMTDQDFQKIILDFAEAYHTLELRLRAMEEVHLKIRGGDPALVERDIKSQENLLAQSFQEKYKILRANFAEAIRQGNVEVAARALLQAILLSPKAKP